MTTSAAEPRGLELAVHRWRVFWFLPESTSVLGVVRIAFGALMVGWTLSLLPDLTDLFGDHGVMPAPPHGNYEWSLLDLADSPRALYAFWAVLGLASIALMVGWHSRLAAVLVFVGVMTFERGSPYVFNSGDNLIRLEALLLVLAPTGAAFSLDRLRTVGSFWSAQVRAPWVIRLMQVQLSVIYLFSVLNKLTGDTWPEGTAVSYALRMTDIGNFAVPDWITMNALLTNVVTWGVVVLEVAIGVLVWKRRARPWVLGAGVVLHVGLSFTFGIGFFSLAMFVLYLAFLSPAFVSAWLERDTGTTSVRSAVLV